MRIVMLEKQSESGASPSNGNFSSSTGMSFTGSSSTAHSNEMQKLNKLEYEAAQLRTEMGSNVSREELIVRLEQSLNQKEYEIQENQKAYNQELDLLNNDLLKVRREQECFM